MRIHRDIFPFLFSSAAASADASAAASAAASASASAAASADPAEWNGGLDARLRIIVTAQV